jgi:signal peptidase I
MCHHDGIRADATSSSELAAAQPGTRSAEDLAADLLRRGEPLRIKARGGSMMPFLRDGDTALVAPTPAGTIAIGDVVCYGAPAGTLVLHRVVGRERNRFVTKGDALRVTEVVDARNLLGRVVAVERQGRVRSFDTRVARWRHRIIAALGPVLPQCLVAAGRLKRAWRAVPRG